MLIWLLTVLTFAAVDTVLYWIEAIYTIVAVPPKVAPCGRISMSPDTEVVGIPNTCNWTAAGFRPAGNCDTQVPFPPCTVYVRTSLGLNAPPAYTGENAPRVSTSRHGGVGV